MRKELKIALIVLGIIIIVFFICSIKLLINIDNSIRIPNITTTTTETTTTEVIPQVGSDIPGDETPQVGSTRCIYNNRINCNGVMILMKEMSDINGETVHNPYEMGDYDDRIFVLPTKYKMIKSFTLKSDKAYSEALVTFEINRASFDGVVLYSKNKGNKRVEVPKVESNGRRAVYNIRAGGVFAFATKE